MTTGKAALLRAREGLWRLEGELDFKSVAELHPRLSDALQRGKAVDLDLGGVTRANSAGLALLLQWLEDAGRCGATLRILNPSKALMELAELSGLERLLPVDGV